MRQTPRTRPRPPPRSRPDAAEVTPTGRTRIHSRGWGWGCGWGWAGETRAWPLPSARGRSLCAAPAPRAVPAPVALTPLERPSYPIAPRPSNTRFQTLRGTLSPHGPLLRALLSSNDLLPARPGCARPVCQEKAPGPFPPQGGHLGTLRAAPVLRFHRSPGCGHCVRAAAEGAAVGGSGDRLARLAQLHPLAKALKFVRTQMPRGFAHNSRALPAVCSSSLPPHRGPGQPHTPVLGCHH